MQCKTCQSPFEITNEDRQFLEKLSPEFGGKVYQLPEPTLCPDCRLQRRMCFRNERHLYHRKSDLSGKQIIANYSTSKPYKVYDQDEWRSDEWDATDYGRDFDFSRTFTEQFKALCLEVPQVSLHTINVENSTYTNFTLNVKNSYLVFGGAHLEDVLFSKFVTKCSHVLDSLSLYNCQYCYEGIASNDCYQCFFFKNCQHCVNSVMIENCQRVKNSMMCFGLQDKEYYVLNEFVGKEAFEKMKEELMPLTNEKIEIMRKRLESLKKSQIHRSSHIYSSENCSGDLLSECKNCFHCFDMEKSEDCRYVMMDPKSVWSMDCTYGSPDGAQFCYETISTIGSRMISTFMTWYCDRVFYSMECSHSKELLGCVGIRNKEYCILNKQYTQEEYETLVPKIIEHMTETEEWGEFLSPQLSHMGYNETIAQEYFPLTQKQALEKGFQWFEEMEIKSYKGPKIDPPQNINEVTDNITDQILSCEEIKRPYKIIPQELTFYKKYQLPLPKKCPDQRHLDRVNLRGPYKLWERKCDHCSKYIQSIYSLERGEKVYCEECYLGEIY